MDEQQIQCLLAAVSPILSHKDTAMRNAITHTKRLAVTLQCLATRVLLYHYDMHVMLTIDISIMLLL